jgi:hypothetical protein
MRKMTFILAGALALSFAIPAFAQMPPPPPPPGMAMAPAGGIINWLAPRYRWRAMRLRQFLGLDNWAKVKGLWFTVVRPRVRPMRRRQMAAFMRLAGNFLRGVRRGIPPDVWLGRARARWERRPVFAVPPGVY